MGIVSVLISLLIISLLYLFLSGSFNNFFTYKDNSLNYRQTINKAEETVDQVNKNTKLRQDIDKNSF